jgi:cytochrome c oxidase subunit 2
MKKQWFAAGAFLMLMLGGCGQATQQPSSQQVPANAVKVHVIASDFKWTLDKTDFQVGKPIDFIVSSKEGTHGFSIEGTNISETVSQGDAPVDVVWTPKKSGTYTIRCNVFCGSGHANMMTTIHVH